MIRELKLSGFLSFGVEHDSVPLRSLNVLVGPNGAGKSNLIEALALLRCAPTGKGLAVSIARGGGIREWLWKGDEPVSEAVIECVIEDARVAAGRPLRYRMALGSEGDHFVLADERVESESPRPGMERPFIFFGYERGRPMISTKLGEETNQRELVKADIDRSQSILAQRVDPEFYPELTSLGSLLKAVRVYREWSFGPGARVRDNSPAHASTSELAEELDNLPTRLSYLLSRSASRERIKECIREISPSFDDVTVLPEGGQLKLEVLERSQNISARRLSDGTLRFLCLVAILIDPAPPPLLIIEEPEIGLHPDTLLAVRDLLVEASMRTQIVVTTHSPLLLDALAEHPESIIICDRADGRTTLRRLFAEEIEEWGDDRSLAELWLSGHLGGTRF